MNIFVYISIDIDIYRRLTSGSPGVFKEMCSSIEIYVAASCFTAAFTNSASPRRARDAKRSAVPAEFDMS